MAFRICYLPLRKGSVVPNKLFKHNVMLGITKHSVTHNLNCLFVWVHASHDSAMLGMCVENTPINTWTRIRQKEAICFLLNQAANNDEAGNTILDTYQDYVIIFVCITLNKR